MLNLQILVGRIGKDPEISYTQGGTAVCKFSLATSEVWTDGAGQRQEKTEWHNIVVWGKQGENVAKYLAKGSLAVVVGMTEHQTWQDKEGTKRHSTQVKAAKVVFLPDGKKRAGEQTQSSGPQGYSGRPEQGRSSQGYQGGSPQGYSGDDDDIPF